MEYVRNKSDHCFLFISTDASHCTISIINNITDYNGLCLLVSCHSHLICNILNIYIYIYIYIYFNDIYAKIDNYNSGAAHQRPLKLTIMLLFFWLYGFYKVKVLVFESNHNA